MNIPIDTNPELGRSGTEAIHPSFTIASGVCYRVDIVPFELGNLTLVVRILFI